MAKKLPRGKRKYLLEICKQITDSHNYKIKLARDIVKLNPKLTVDEALANINRQMELRRLYRHHLPTKLPMD